MTNTIEISLKVNADETQLKASQLLAHHSQLSQAKIKDAMQKGAVWLVRGNSKQRLRRASKPLREGDTLELNYNPDLLNQNVPEPQLIYDANEYSVWYKPYGLSCQGSRWGDFASINRWVETNIHKLTKGAERPVFLVHRLDRATTGLMLLCHTKSAARLFSEMFSEGKMDKRYQAIVHGNFSSYADCYQVNDPIEGKTATSIFSFIEEVDDCSLVDVRLMTGRKHQIRRHLSGLGHPIVGDRLYGNGEHQKDLQLQSVSLGFTCPLTQESKQFVVSDELRLAL